MSETLELLGFRRTMAPAANPTWVNGRVRVEYHSRAPFRNPSRRSPGWYTVSLGGDIIWSANVMMADDDLMDLLVEDERANS